MDRGVTRVAYPIETQVYSPREIAAAAGVPECDVIAAVGGARAYVGHDEAVSLALSLRRSMRPASTTCASEAATPFGMFRQVRGTGASRVPLAISGTLHAGLISAAILVTSLATTPAATTTSTPTADDAQLVFLNLPGPGGGGGGGGAREPVPVARARRAGRQSLSSPVPDRQTAPPAEAPPHVTPPPPADPPVVTAPVAPSATDADNRAGTIDSTVDSDSRGPGAESGAGDGRGSGIGAGDGSGISQGSGGGTGGGPYRPGAGITPPRLLHEEKPAYTEEARHAGVTGEVVLEVVVRRDGTVGDVRVLKRLGSGLDQRAIDAVRQWRFAPAMRQGVAVDLLVEVAVDFGLR